MVDIAVIVNSDPSIPFESWYRSDETRLLDHRFGLVGDGLSNRTCELLDSSISRPLGRFEVEKVLEYFVNLAKSVGYFVGLRYDELEDQINSIDITAAVDYEQNRSPPYLLHKMINGEKVLFPANLPIPEEL